MNSQCACGNSPCVKRMAGDWVCQKCYDMDHKRHSKFDKRIRVDKTNFSHSAPSEVNTFHSPFSATWMIR